jgi:hypothetical protein
MLMNEMQSSDFSAHFFVKDEIKQEMDDYEWNFLLNTIKTFN